MSRYIRNARRSTSYPLHPSPDMFSSAYGTQYPSVRPSPHYDEVDEAIHRTLRTVHENLPRLREDRDPLFNSTIYPDTMRWSSTPSASSSLSPTLPEPREIYTLNSALDTHPFYTRHEIPLSPLNCFLQPLLLEDQETGTVLHAIHPVSRRALRQMIPDELRFVGEDLDERLYEMIEINDFAEHMYETLMRINELLERQGEDGVSCACRHRERIALRGNVCDGAARDDGAGSEETAVEEQEEVVQAVNGIVEMEH